MPLHHLSTTYLTSHQGEGPGEERWLKLPWKQSVFWQGLENAMDFMPGILPKHFRGDKPSI